MPDAINRPSRWITGTSAKADPAHDRKGKGPDSVRAFVSSGQHADRVFQIVNQGLQELRAKRTVDNPVINRERH